MLCVSYSTLLGLIFEEVFLFVDPRGRVVKIIAHYKNHQMNAFYNLYLGAVMWQ